MPSERFGPRERARCEALAKLAPPEQTLTWAQVDHVSEERLWWAMRRLEQNALMVLFARAVAEVPAARLERVFGGYVGAHEIGAPASAPEPDIESVTRAFCELARQGHYYEEMDYCGSQQSGGTERFTARCNALFDRAVGESRTGDPHKVRAAFEMLMDLLRRIDAFEEDIVYFTDEGGAWQIGVLWSNVVPAYLSCVAATASRAEFDVAVELLLKTVEEPDARRVADAAEAAWNGGRPVHPIVT